MTRHVIDHRADTAPPDTLERLETAARKAAPEGGHPAAKAAHRRPHDADSGRVKAFLRIDRGKRA